MSEMAMKAASMLDMLPEHEQQLAFEIVKRIVLMWDADYTKLTPTERAELEEAQEEMKRGETIPLEAFAAWNDNESD